MGGDGADVGEGVGPDLDGVQGGAAPPGEEKDGRVERPGGKLHVEPVQAIQLPGAQAQRRIGGQQGQGQVAGRGGSGPAQGEAHGAELGDAQRVLAASGGAVGLAVALQEHGDRRVARGVGVTGQGVAVADRGDGLAQVAVGEGPARLDAVAGGPVDPAVDGEERHEQADDLGAYRRRGGQAGGGAEPLEGGPVLGVGGLGVAGPAVGRPAGR